MDSSFLEAREARREGEGNNNAIKTNKAGTKRVSNEYVLRGGGGDWLIRQGHPRPQVMIICCAVAMRSEGVQRGN